MVKRSKNYREAAKQVDKNKLYTVKDTIMLVKKINYAKFDSTISVAYRLNIDTKKADQQIRGAIVLPNGTGKTQRVVVFAEGEKAKEAENAGADFVGSDDLVEKIQNGWLDFDVVVAVPMMMAKVGKLGRILGPKGKMPNPKTGTVTMDVAKAVKNIKSGQVAYRADKTGIIHVPIGKASFSDEKLIENLEAIHDAIIKARPVSVKGTYIKSLVASSTFGPGVKIDSYNM